MMYYLGVTCLADMNTNQNSICLMMQNSDLTTVAFIDVSVYLQTPVSTPPLNKTGLYMAQQDLLDNPLHHRTFTVLDDDKRHKCYHILHNSDMTYFYRAYDIY